MRAQGEDSNGLPLASVCNFVTVGPPALALTLEPPEPSIMERPPHKPGESTLSWNVGFTIDFQWLLLGLAGLAAFAFDFLERDIVERAQSMTFSVVVYAELFRALASRSERLTLWQLGC